MKKKLIFISLFISSLTLLSFKSDYFEIAKNLEIFTDLYKELNTYYVDETDPGKLIKSAMDEMLQTLDPLEIVFSQFLLFLPNICRQVYKSYLQQLKSSSNC